MAAANKDKTTQDPKAAPPADQNQQDATQQPPASPTVKLKAPKHVTAVSVMGQEYKVVKGEIVAFVHHVEALIERGFEYVKKAV